MLTTPRNALSGPFRLGAAEPTLHRPARELERLLKTPLYRRTAEGIGLSSVGEELARRFVPSTAEIETGIGELESHRGSSEMTATVGVLALAPKTQLAAVAKTLREIYPNSRLVIQEGAYDELMQGLRSGAIYSMSVYSHALTSVPTITPCLLL